MLTYCHVGVGQDVAKKAINLVRRFDSTPTQVGFLPSGVATILIIVKEMLVNQMTKVTYVRHSAENT